MGLDMYLEGKLFQWTDWENPEKNEKRDGKKIKEITVELSYWRKHPDLHGYIVNEFADGKDECQEIDLDREEIGQIIKAIEEDALAHGTDGFFFGKSYQPGEEGYDKQKAYDLDVWREALEWYDARMKEREQGSAYDPYFVYRASW